MSDLDALRDKAKSQADAAEAKTWKPTEAGDELAGYLRKIDYAFTNYGEGFVVTVEDEDGDMWTVWCTGAVLANQILDQAPAIDSPVVFLYEGQKKNQAGTFNYKAYQLAATESDFQAYVKVQKEAVQKEQMKQADAVSAVNAANQSGVVDPEDLTSPF